MTVTFLHQRQYSSTEGNSNIKQVAQPTVRQCSSADNHTIEPMPDKNQSKKKMFSKGDQTSSENDSGTDDLDQQMVNFVCLKTNNENEEQSSPLLTAHEDEGFEENFSQMKIEEEQVVGRIRNDLALAARLFHREKKDFCADTREVFHAEFARHISIPISLNYPGIRYNLFAEDEVEGGTSQWAGSAFCKVDNAKAQYKCPNICCQRLWTSMRSRISFKISQPRLHGYVLLKIYGQNCQDCKTFTDALWYMEEVCRVIENLSKTIFGVYFPSMNNNNGEQTIQSFDRALRRPRYDPTQRKGTMRAAHDKYHCEACQHGLCFL